MGHIGKTITQNIVSTSEITDGTITNDDLASDIAISTTGTITTTADLTVDTDALKVDVSAERIGVNTASPEGTLHVKGKSTEHGKVYIQPGGSGGSSNNSYLIFTRDNADNAAGIQLEGGETATNSNSLIISTNNADTLSEKWRFTHDGDLKVANAGNGIDFSASADTGGAGDWATVSNEKLTDYEYGTFNPRFYDITGSLSYGYQSGRYVRVGNLCHFQFYIYVTGQNGNNNAYTVERLPFTVSNDTNSNSYSSCSVWAGFGFNNSDATAGYSALTIGNTDRVTVYGHLTAYNGSNHNYTQIIYSNCASATGFYCAGTYYVA